MARRPWRTDRLPEIVSIKGALPILGVDKTTLYRWMEPDPETGDTYMIPPARVIGSNWPVWDKRDVEQFAVRIGRLRGPEGETAEQKALRNALKADPDRLKKQIRKLQDDLAAAKAARGES